MLRDTLVALALAACFAGPALGRGLLESQEDSGGSPVTAYKPITYSYNWTSTYDLAGTWQISEFDPRVDAALNDGVVPEQLSLQYYGEDELQVTWQTGRAISVSGPVTHLPLPEDSSDIEFVLGAAPIGDPDDVLSFSGNVSSYDQIYFGFPTAVNYTSAVFHKVVATGLEPGETYSYRVGSAKDGVWSDWRTTAVPPAVGSYPLRLGLIADGGQTYNSSTTYDGLKNSNIDALLFVGDLSYADTRYSNSSYLYWLVNATISPEDQAQLATPQGFGTFQPRWDTWGRLIEPLVSTVPTLYTSGNHEIEEQSTGEKWASYYARAGPNPATSGSRQYYSADIGPVHIVSLSSYVGYNESTAQYDWLIQDLEAVDRDATPWIIVTIHEPFYTSYSGSYQILECMLISIEPIFYKYGIDAVFSGHVHAYERTNPVYNYEVDECGPIYVTVGDGGNVEKLVTTFADTPGFCPAKGSHGPTFQPEVCYRDHYDGKFCDDKQPEWSALREPAFGFSTLEILNSTHAHYQWFRNEDPEPVASDDVYFVKKPCGRY